MASSLSSDEFAQPVAAFCLALQQQAFKAAVALTATLPIAALTHAQCSEVRKALFEQRKWLNTYPALLLTWAQAEKALNSPPDLIEALLWRILKWQPEHAEALKALGQLKSEHECFEQAMVLFRRLLQQTPTDWDVWKTGACALQALQKTTEALTWLQESLRHAPESAQAELHARLALLNLEQHDTAAAQHALETALTLAPHHPLALYAHAQRLHQQGQLDAAHQLATQVLTAAPDFPPVRLFLAQLDLARGQWAVGFAGYESRWAGAEQLFRRKLPTIGRPQWRGHALYAGSRLAVLPEQDAGFHLQFARFIPLLLERFAHVDWCVPPDVFSLLADNFIHPRLTVHQHLSTLPRHLIDVECPLLSLPLALGITLENVPTPESYLQAPATQRAQFEARFAGIGALKVGLAWHDGTAFSANAPQHIPTDALAQLDEPGVLFVNLQKPLPPEQPIPALSTWADWMPECADLSSTAALLSTLDLVICSDTHIAHLAGAMGVPVWLLNPLSGGWPWLHRRKTSPWYPSMHILTQATPGDWTPTLQGVRAALRQAVALQME